jgi:UDP-glucose 4-epimerase
VDLVEGYLRVFETLETRNGLDVWNLGTGQCYSILEMIRVFEAASG